MNASTSKLSLLMGLLCALAALLIAALYGLVTGNFGDSGLLLAAPVSAFLTGTLTWWCMQPKAGRISKRRGAVAGGLTGILAHYPFWLCVMLVSAFCPEQADGCRWPDENSVSLFQSFSVALFLTLASLIVVGWLTAPVAAAIGAKLTGAQDGTRQ